MKFGYFEATWFYSKDKATVFNVGIADTGNFEAFMNKAKL